MILENPPPPTQFPRQGVALILPNSPGEEYAKSIHVVAVYYSPPPSNRRSMYFAKYIQIISKSVVYRSAQVQTYRFY